MHTLQCQLACSVCLLSVSPTTYYLLPTTTYYLLLPTTSCSLLLRTTHSQQCGFFLLSHPSPLAPLTPHYSQECGFFLLSAAPSPLGGDTAYELLAAAGVAAGGTVSKQVIE